LDAAFARDEAGVAQFTEDLGEKIGRHGFHLCQVFDLGELAGAMQPGHFHEDTTGVFNFNRNLHPRTKVGCEHWGNSNQKVRSGQPTLAMLLVVMVPVNISPGPDASGLSRGRKWHVPWMHRFSQSAGAA
jgi:hypothetical protein